MATAEESLGQTTITLLGFIFVLYTTTSYVIEAKRSNRLMKKSSLLSVVWYPFPFSFCFVSWSAAMCHGDDTHTAIQVKS
jgi:hypothetical protein